MSEDPVDVVIAGGGAVGLALAIELGWRGRRVLVLEQGDGVIEHPRTGRISERTMEFCRRWGIAEQVRGNPFPQDYELDVVFCTSLSGFELTRVAGPSMARTAPPQQTPESTVRCPQFWFDPILAEAARSHPGVEIALRTRLDGFAVDGDEVVADVTDLGTGRPRQVRGSYLVGCDGATSTVRTALGVAMSGNPLLNYSVNVLFRAPDLLRQVGTAAAERFILVGPDGTTGNITVVDGRDLWRLTVMGSQERLDLRHFDAAAEIRRAAGRDDLDVTVLSVSPWRRTELVADRYRDGRVFLCGDAVHTMSPTGGFGANTGIGDAVDLGWKLDAVLAGWGGGSLLDSYEVERRPVAIRNARAATHNFHGWSASGDLTRVLDDTPAGREVRDAAGQQLAAATRAEWQPLGVILGYRYDDSPICVPDGTPAPPDSFGDYVPTARPGARAPHVWLAAGTSTLDLFGRGLVLLCPHDAPRPDLAGSDVPVAVVGVAPQVLERYGARHILVRPDGHVAWRADDLPADLGEVLAVATGRTAAASAVAAPVISGS